MSGRLASALAAAVERALESAGYPATIARAVPIGGGCINHGAWLVTEADESFFLKWNAHAPAGMFAAEADGLRALAAPNVLRVPGVIAHGDAPAFLLLEYVEPGRPGPDYAERLGAGLAALHRSAESSAPGASPPRWGWPRDNFIGSLSQTNAPIPTWGAFWRDRRLAPQLALARDRGHFTGGDGRELDRVLERCEKILADVEGLEPSLLHGDLWGGNAYAGAAGEPVLIDPAVYRGHFEVDLAMSELFGGFPEGWPRAYVEARPLEAAYDDHRRALYQLYYLLVHVNLFGAGYEAGCVRAAREALGGG